MTLSTSSTSSSHSRPAIWALTERGQPEKGGGRKPDQPPSFHPPGPRLGRGRGHPMKSRPSPPKRQLSTANLRAGGRCDRARIPENPGGGAGRAGVSPGDVESLPTPVAVARHAGSRGCLALPALLLTDVARLRDTAQLSPPLFYLWDPLTCCSLFSPRDPRSGLSSPRFCDDGNFPYFAVPHSSHEPHKLRNT